MPSSMPTCGSLASVSNWREARLSDICTGIFDCPHSTPALTDSGPFVVRTQDIRSGTFRADEAAHVSEATYQERIARAEPSPGDIVFSRKGTYFGIAAEVPQGCRVCLGQRMVLIRPDPSIADARFVRHWLNSPAMAAHIQGHRDGSVAERLNLPTIRDLPIALPPLSLQRRIASILGALDDKIELNRRLSETLEGAAQALFRSWFLDSDSDASDQHGSLADAADLLRDQVDPQLEPDTVFQHYSLPAYDAGRAAISEPGAGIRSSKFAVPRGSVLLSKLNPQIERVWLPDIRPDDRAICSTEFLVLRPRADVGRAFVYGFLTGVPQLIAPERTPTAPADK